MKNSPYLEWAKTKSQAKFNLATSGLTSVAFADFPFDPKAFEVTSPGGYSFAPLQEELSRLTGAPPPCIVAATGTSMANHLAMATLLDAGNEVLIEQPAYGPLLDVAHYLGARVTRLPRRLENGFAIDLDELRKKISRTTRLIILSNLHNPSGALIPAETLRAIGEIASENGAHVLVDEVYLEMVFEQPAPFCFPIGETFAGGNPFVVTSSLTKAYGLSGLRCGWILASAELAQRMWRMSDLFEGSPAHPADRMSVMALKNLAQFRERARAQIEKNRGIMKSFLDAREDLECFRPDFGTVFFPRLQRGDCDAFLKLLRDKYETTAVPGKFFEMPNHFRLGVGGSAEELRAGLERIGAALDEFATH